MCDAIEEHDEAEEGKRRKEVSNLWEHASLIRFKGRL